MIECNLDNHKDIFYSSKLYAKHIITEHHKIDVPPELYKWAKKITLMEKSKN